MQCKVAMVRPNACSVGGECMPGYRIPLSLWPLRRHIVVASALLVVLILAVLALGRWQAAQQQAMLSHTAALQQELLQLEQQRGFSASPDLFSTLPVASRGDDVTRDIARFALTHGVQISTVGIEARKASETQWPQHLFQVSAQCAYPDCKAWLAELLDRYPSLTVQSLSLQSHPQSPAQLDLRASLAWYVRGGQE